MDRKGDVSSVNTSIVMKQVWLSGRTSRAELARTTGLHAATISRIINRLVDIGLVVFGEEQDASARGGRRATDVQINSEFGVIVGLEIQTDMYHAVGTTVSGEVLFSRSGELPVERTDILESFQTVFGEIRDDINAQSAPLLGVAVGLSGLVDPYSGVILSSNPLNIPEPVEFRRQAEAFVSVPLLVENDANCGCWGELAASGTDRPEDMLYVLGEFREPRAARREGHTVAVGMGFVLDGHVRHGSHYSAGEFQSILWTEGNSSQFSLTDEEILRAGSDPRIRDRVIRELGKHVGLSVNLLDLTDVVVGGDMVNYRDTIETVFAEEIQRNWSYPNAVDCRVGFSGMGEYAVAYGAAAMFVEHLFAVPTESRGTPSQYLGIHLLDHLSQHVNGTSG